MRSPALRPFFSRHLGWILLSGLALVFCGDVVCHIAAENSWFRELGYADVFRIRLRARLLLWVTVLGVSGGFVWLNLWLAHRLAQPEVTAPNRMAYRRPGAMGLSWLMLTLVGLSTLLLFLGYHYGAIVFETWRPAIDHLEEGVGSAFRIRSRLFPALPVVLRFQTLLPILQDWVQTPLWFGAIGLLAILLASIPWFTLIAFGTLLTLALGSILAGQWARILAAVHPTPFGQLAELLEPDDRLGLIFSHDLSFYIFSVPMAKLLQFWSFGLLFYALVAVLVIYLLADKSMESGYFGGFSLAQQHHLYSLAAGFLLSVAGNYALACYDQLYSPRGVTYGASYTDVMVQIPVNQGLALGAIGLAMWCSLHIFVCWIYGRQLRQVQVLGPSCALEAEVPPRSSFQSRSQPYVQPRPQARSQSRPQSQPFLYWQPFHRRSWQQKLLSNRWILMGFGLYTLLALVLGKGVPQAVQNFIVQPNELARETRYIKRSIAATREAFGLNNIEVRTFDPLGSFTAETLKNNAATLQNIRLWDSRPLLQTNRQLQQIRLYYSFPDADVDRYTIGLESDPSAPERARTSPAGGASNAQPNDPANPTAPNANLQQVLLSARELDYGSVPAEAQTWVNEHLVYTHGYGFTLSPVNTVGDGGLPDYFVRDIGDSSGDSNEDSALYIANEAVRESIPIGKPRIYYGALTNTYVMTSTRVQELDYPSGNENFYNVYDGAGGVSLGAFWQRLMYAVHLRDWQMLLTRNFTPETKLLFRREIKSRIQAIAPFLRYDQDPYLVIADPSQGANNALDLQSGVDPQKLDPQELDSLGLDSQDLGSTGLNFGSMGANAEADSSESYLYWIVDAYTTTDRYPYADPGDHEFNYIRNSVKVVVDAYNGSVNFYVADPSDPLIQTWSQVFPTLFQPLEAMPAALRQHLRYPSQLFKVQSEQLLTYHMTDPQVFYNREDQWQVPQEIYGGEAQQIESYYLIMRLPTEENEEFILLNPFTPVSRNNLVGWLAGRSDGDNYGKLLLYEFPKQRLIFGPEQIEARINQDPVISQRISLWNQQGSRAVQGNLLVIPLDDSLLYVEPLYLEAERNSLPTLVRVIVVHENRIVMAETLEKALNALVEEDQGASGGLQDSEAALDADFTDSPDLTNPTPTPTIDPINPPILDSLAAPTPIVRPVETE
ncbi:MAG: UPF0182 family protein [Prochlorothrix sp.]|nr:UPF0182 family protein [Prochlorothrix sp.]